jgi:hypothetical protein
MLRRRNSEIETWSPFKRGQESNTDDNYWLRGGLLSPTSYLCKNYTILNLSKTILPYLDRLSITRTSHRNLLVFNRGSAAQYELAKGTNIMVDYAVSLFAELNPDKEVPAGKLLSFGLPLVVVNNGFYRIQCQT